jgi:hypothetical protein
VKDVFQKEDGETAQRTTKVAVAQPLFRKSF